LSRIARWALACVVSVVDSRLHTSGVVAARQGVTRVDDGRFTVDSGVSIGTLTLILIVLDFDACPVVLAWIGFTWEQTNLADEIVVGNGCVLNKLRIAGLNIWRASTNVLIATFLHFVHQIAEFISIESSKAWTLFTVVHFCGEGIQTALCLRRNADSFRALLAGHLQKPGSGRVDRQLEGTVTT